MKKILFNPFERYSEIALLLFGLLATIVASLAAYYCNGRFDGIIDMHLAEEVPLSAPFVDNAINTVTLFCLLFILGVAINRKTRAIDVLNTVLIARLPIYLLPLFNISNRLKSIEDSINVAYLSELRLEVPDLIFLLVFALVSLLCLAWFAVLLYKGFKISANSKTTGHKVLFATVILLAELLSKYIHYLI